MISSQFGPDGQRWKKVTETNGDVAMVSLRDGSTDLVNAANVEHCNSTLSGPNRRIREETSRDFSIEEIKERRDQLNDNIAVIREAIMQSEI